MNRMYFNALSLCLCLLSISIGYSANYIIKYGELIKSANSWNTAAQTYANNKQQVPVGFRIEDEDDNDVTQQILQSTTDKVVLTDITSADEFILNKLQPTNDAMEFISQQNNGFPIPKTSSSNRINIRVDNLSSDDTFYLSSYYYGVHNYHINIYDQSWNKLNANSNHFYVNWMPLAVNYIAPKEGYIPGETSFNPKTFNVFPDISIKNQKKNLNYTSLAFTLDKILTPTLSNDITKPFAEIDITYLASRLNEKHEMLSIGPLYFPGARDKFGNPVQTAIPFFDNNDKPVGD